MRALAVAAGLVALAGPALAAKVQEATYICERGVQIEAIYINEMDVPAIAVVQVEGHIVPLKSVPTGSGARYQGSLALSGYVWWTRGHEAMLVWYDAEVGEDVTIYADCKEAE